VPMIWGCAAGVTAPAVMKAVGVTVTAESLLESETVTPAPGAGPDKVTGKGAGWFGPIFTPVGRLIMPLAPPKATVTLATPLVTLAALALIDVVPVAIGVT